MKDFNGVLGLYQFDDLVIERSIFPYITKVYTKLKDPVLLEERSYHPNYLMRSAVALSDYSSIETLERLSYDESWWVRWEVAANPRTPQYVLDLHKFKGYLKYYG
jgi:hypothetical protein